MEPTPKIPKAKFFFAPLIFFLISPTKLNYNRNGLGWGKRGMGRAVHEKNLFNCPFRVWVSSTALEITLYHQYSGTGFPAGAEALPGP